MTTIRWRTRISSRELTRTVLLALCALLLQSCKAPPDVPHENAPSPEIIEVEVHQTPTLADPAFFNLDEGIHPVLAPDVAGIKELYDGVYCRLQCSANEELGLALRLEIWNLSPAPEIRWINPFHPMSYSFEFRDSAGEDVHVVLLGVPPGTMPILDESHLIKLYPGMVAGAVFRIPSFYERVFTSKPFEVRVHVGGAMTIGGITIWPNADEGVSDWVPVPVLEPVSQNAVGRSE